MLLEHSRDLPSSRRELVANILRESILNGKLKPGDRIREKEISDQLGVSRGPIREAIRQLEQEGLLISYPYKETVVAENSEDDIIDVLISIRIILETFSAKKACERLTDKDIDQLKRYVANMIEAGENNDLSKLVENNLLFHQYLVFLSGSKALEQIWSSIMNRIRIHFYDLGRKMESTLSEHAREHEEFLMALIEKNEEKAQQLITNHIK